jgi:hypothetical protein
VASAFDFDIARLLDSLPSADSGGQKPAAGTSDEMAGESTPAETEMMDVTRMELDAAAEEEMEVVIQCLEEIAKALSNPDHIMVNIFSELVLIYSEMILLSSKETYSYQPLPHDSNIIHKF